MCIPGPRTRSRALSNGVGNSCTDKDVPRTEQVSAEDDKSTYDPSGASERDETIAGSAARALHDACVILATLYILWVRPPHPRCVYNFDHEDFIWAGTLFQQPDPGPCCSTPDLACSPDSHRDGCVGIAPGSKAAIPGKPSPWAGGAPANPCHGNPLVPRGKHPALVLLRPPTLDLPSAHAPPVGWAPLHAASILPAQRGLAPHAPGTLHPTRHARYLDLSNNPNP